MARWSDSQFTVCSEDSFIIEKCHHLLQIGTSYLPMTNKEPNARKNLKKVGQRFSMTKIKCRLLQSRPLFPININYHNIRMSNPHLFIVSVLHTYDIANLNLPVLKGSTLNGPLRTYAATSKPFHFSLSKVQSNVTCSSISLISFSKVSFHLVLGLLSEHFLIHLYQISIYVPATLDVYTLYMFDWSKFLLDSIISLIFSSLIHKPMILLAFISLETERVTSSRVFPKRTMSSAYAKTDSLITFSSPRLNKVGDKASPCLNPELTSKNGDIYIYNYSYMFFLRFTYSYLHHNISFLMFFYKQLFLNQCLLLTHFNLTSLMRFLNYYTVEDININKYYIFIDYTFRSRDHHTHIKTFKNMCKQNE
ncbi:hypothetical protein AGLY_010756 [Aphis glycines]|uniref:Uncharacterized protein n=1 Tax=Aphis glycines TaxID=307491 RepID=A0A6G0TFS7_APHGL|nr:hypothetical protein AGLY_010756 [Aphis glycines]